MNAALVVCARQQVCNVAAKLMMAPSVRSVILTGSMAREEDTWNASGDELLGDAEFLIVCRRSLRSGDLAAEVESELGSLGIKAHISAAIVRESYLRKLRPSIFAFETKACGRVIAGDPSVLDLIPDCADVPQEDAWRMLCNRTVELIAAEGPYRTVKLVLDSATSLLVFLGRYSPTYRSRRDTLLRVHAPQELDGFAQIVDRCTRWKLSHGDSTPPVERAEAMRFARWIWRWETGVLLGDDTSPQADAEVVLELARRQSLLKRVRGWAYAVRQFAAMRGWRDSTLHIGLSASPRYRVYAAAFGGEEWRHVLPVALQGRAFSSELARNYQWFLEGTTS